jgi:hypothetical protein
MMTMMIMTTTTMMMVMMTMTTIMMMRCQITSQQLMSRDGLILRIACGYVTRGNFPSSQ